MKKQLTQWDCEVLTPFIIGILQERNGTPVDNRTIRNLVIINMKRYAASSTIRGVIHKIRTEHLLDNVVASTSGYWISNDIHEITKYLSSLQDRAMQIHEVQSALRKQLQRTLVGQLEITEEPCV